LTSVMKLLTTQQAADMLGVKPATLRGWRCAKTGPKFTRLTARSVKYAQVDLDRFIAERTVTPSVRVTEVNHGVALQATAPPPSPAFHRRNR
jgi:predicted DNA-binding transcriptional regulator AlpA